MRRTHRWLLLALLPSLLARAGTREDEVASALAEARAAQEEADDASGGCRRKLSTGLESLVDRLKEAQRGPRDKVLRSARDSAEDLVDLAKDACTGSAAKRLGRPLGRVVSALERAGSTPASAASNEQRATKGGLLTVGANIAHGLGGLFNGGAAASSSTSKSETSTSRRTETVNGHPVEGDDLGGAGRSQAAKGAFGATCNHNADCASSTCFVGNGSVGYCTKLCDSFTECPTFWECKRAANAPQKICLQH
jgi:hypothetical protein